MLDLLLRFDEECERAYRIGTSLKAPSNLKDFENIVFCGLGGSAIGADILRVYLQKKISQPILVNRNYTIPYFVGRNSLVFVSSYSGNTEETISSFEEAFKKGAKIVAVSSGGRLKEMAKNSKIFHIEIPSGFPPRSAIMYMIIPILIFLSRLGIAKDLDKEVSFLKENLKRLKDSTIGPDVPLKRNLSKKLAIKLHNRFPVIYGTSDTTEAVAIRWRSQIAENAKHLSSSHIFPELNHNEIVGWEFPERIIKDFKVIMLHDRDDHKRNKKRIEITKTIIEKSDVEVLDVEADRGDLLSRLFSLIYIGDFMSFYLAILNGVDPTPVKRVEYLKRELAKIKHR